MRRRWGQRFGLVTDDLCAPQWPDDVLRALPCEMRTRQSVVNWDFNCGPIGWWTMARSVTACSQDETCPIDIEPNAWVRPWMRLEPTCATVPDSLNIVLSPIDMVSPPNCNLPAVSSPHDDELYAALKWLPKLLPRTVLWCVYDANPENCVV